MSPAATAAEGSDEHGRAFAQRDILLKPLSIVSGLLMGLGIPILLQQFSVRPMTTGLLVAWLIAGLVLGVAVPTIAYHAARSRAGR